MKLCPVFSRAEMLNTAAHSPLEDFLSLLLRDLDSQIPKGLHDFLGIDAAWGKSVTGKHQVP